MRMCLHEPDYAFCQQGDGSLSWAGEGLWCRHVSSRRAQETMGQGFSEVGFAVCSVAGFLKPS